jgi:hypothetical protein
MEGLNEHLKQEAERQQQMAGGGGQGQDGMVSGGSSQNIPVSGDIAGFAGVKVERVDGPE